MCQGLGCSRVYSNWRVEERGRALGVVCAPEEEDAEGGGTADLDDEDEEDEEDEECEERCAMEEKEEVEEEDVGGAAEVMVKG